MQKRVSILGSTGSIGVNALSIIAHLKGFCSYFPFSEFNAYAKLNVQSISKVNIFDYWGIIHAINTPAS